MTGPLLAAGHISPITALWLALPIGMAFGYVLERAGLADPRKLAAQFLLTDLTVMKVMFTAIVSAALGIFWLGRVGWLSQADIYLPPTNLVPQVVGGLVFGAGFVVAGYCPGTSCVAAASGRRDALAVIGGMLVGTFIFAESIGWIGGLYDATPLGAVTWYHLIGMSQGAAVGALVLAALVVFAVARRIERRPERTRRRPLLIATGAVVVALLTAAAGQRPSRSAPTSPAGAGDSRHAPVPRWQSPIKC